ncbi:4Fe-4S binding protein [Eggerthella guodeyinii]|uniref:4Fe-4S binding protein n=1 Tax=Eggerthella guodeyinii TaxID=2690837 RepID=A0A6N7RJ04_9ACTN|nr:4Fe-4S binding protein [Eggerthella guodeyinii]MRX81239.1 4Fe-4S binding protein [Eggerthella guodeyinii]
MSDASNAPRTLRWSWLRHTVQAAALVLFAAPVIAVGWGLFGTSVGGDDAVAAPADLPFFGSLSSSSIGGFEILDPFGTLQVAAASKTFELDWLLAVLPVLVVYGLIKGRAFCGWVCPVNLLLEIVDAVRRKLRIEVREMPVPRHAKLWIALAVLALSALTSVPVFEAFSPISAINKGILFGAVTGVWVLLAIVLAELFWGHRVWCRALCPLGGFYEALGHVGQVNVKFDRSACIRCDACKRSCLSDPVILDPVLTERDVIVRAGDCMACGSCIDACPTRALSFTLGRTAKPKASAEK